MKKKRLYIGLGLATTLVTVVLIVNACQKNNSNVTFETAKVERMTITNTVSATGTLEATTTVEVGTQVSGVIEKIHVDFNSVVKKGQLLAEIDQTSLKSSVDEAEASLDNAKAELEYQESTFKRVSALRDKKLVADADYDLAKYNYDKSKSSLKTAQARYDKAIVNLNYTRIYSPIDGVIMNRAVDEGQTVAASFNTPTLFSIANDLTQMQVEADIDEADIGMVKQGQRVEFEVDAFQDEVFDGKVLEVRLQPVESSNVITYTVVIDAPNPDHKLMPGMTASITAYVEEVDNVLAIPGKALRFTPDRDVMTAYMSKQEPEPAGRVIEGPKVVGGMPAGGGMMMGGTDEILAEDENIINVWIKDNEKIYPRRIEIGVSDGSNVEVLSGLNEGDELIISMSADIKIAKADAETSSTFMPQSPGGGR